MKCVLCPRQCGVDRKRRRGFCGAGDSARVARAMLHQWEEPCISGRRGAGAIFFSGCTMRCCYCQNKEISVGCYGKDVSTDRLAEIMTELICSGAETLDLVSPTPYTPQIIDALSSLSPLPVPVVWNTGGYERVQTLRSLAGIADVYLPDLKYVDTSRSSAYSRTGDYFAAASRAIEEMAAQRGAYTLDERGILRSGVLIRHLMLPGGLSDTKAVIDWVARTFPPHTVLFSLMCQYTPMEGVPTHIDRPVYRSEYHRAVDYMINCGIEHGYIQGHGASSGEFTPEFNLMGV